MTDHTETAREQLLEAMSAVSEDRTCTGWAADWARTLHAEGGIWETLGRAVGWPTGNYDQWEWVSWDEAARLYGHAPAAPVSSAVTAPATNHTDETASCPGYETSPNPCRCPCYGCKHHCGAHNPNEEAATDQAELIAVDALDLVEGPVRCPLCPHPITLHTPNGARAHFTTVHPERRLVGPGPWPLLANQEPPAAAPAVDRTAVRDRIADAVIPLLLDTLPKVIARARGYEAADAVLAVLPSRAADTQPPLSPDYQHPECGFHWHGPDGMDIPMRDGQPVCPRCELRRVEKLLDHRERRCEELRAESKRRGKVKLEYAEKNRLLEREIDEVRRQLGAEILRAGQAEAEARALLTGERQTHPDSHTPDTA